METLQVLTMIEKPYGNWTVLEKARLIAAFGPIEARLHKPNRIGLYGSISEKTVADVLDTASFNIWPAFNTTAWDD